VRACSPPWALLIFQGTLPWQPIKVEKVAFFQDQSTLSHCHLETDCNIAIPISKCSIESVSLHCVQFWCHSVQKPQSLHCVLTVAPFATILQNRHITQNISEYPGPISIYFTGLVGVLVGMIIQIFVWRSPKGRCYGKQLNLGDVHKRRMEGPLLFASAFDNGLADRKSAFKRFTGNNQATSYLNLVNFRPIIFWVYAVKMCNFLPWFARNLTTIIHHVGVSKRIGRLQIWFQQSTVIGNHFCSPCRNLVRVTEPNLTMPLGFLYVYIPNLERTVCRFSYRLGCEISH